MDGLKIILKGYTKGDKNGGPTQLAKILSNSLTTCDGFNKKELISRYQNWWNTDAFDTGPTFAMVFQKVSKGITIENAVLEVHEELNGETAGCGPVHRIAPLAAFRKMSESSLIYYARQEARITHYHIDAGNCSALMVLLCRYLLDGFSWEVSKELVSKNKELKDTWEKIINANLNKGGYVLDVMHSAIYFLDRENSLENSLSFAGPANYCPIIVGIIKNIIKN
ncbi:ADP-ribosylglycohydrolase family protein [Alphaproteobacteria bacterium]|nr:ADP-ribosylglycohydrolase family protein [Alphaproteobacteria bacterium]